MVILAAGTLGSTEILLRSRAQGLSLSDRVGARFSANGDIIAFGYGAKGPVNAIGVGHPAKTDFVTGASVSGQIQIVDPDDLSHSLTIQEGAMPSALATGAARAVHSNGRLLGAVQSLISGVYKGPFAACRRSSPSRTTAHRGVSNWPTTGSRSTGPARRTSPSTGDWTRRLRVS